ncbi:hypothetical protein [Pseudalkalibacillus hwajinpoensis]|uniref:hypothetical protein n=1 Tax=Guptibacillus hwajinpoensis TaxID=208199 RepID=UPI001CFE38BC|nr:hypothetical protein [Pseudalkalibacillus hwajinpoensis]
MARLLFLLSYDLRSIQKDLMTMIAIFAPILMALFFRFITPVLNKMFFEGTSFTSTDQNLVIGLLLLLATPVMLGIMSGFILLDEKDEGVAMSIAVTPFQLKGYLLYRLTLPILVSLILAYPVLLIGGFTEILTLRLLPFLLLILLEIPIIALFMASMAENKVEGLAAAKVVSILLAIPIAIFFVEHPAIMLTGILPPYWPIKGYLLLLDGWNLSAFLILFIGILYHLLLLYSLLKRYERMMR